MTNLNTKLHVHSHAHPKVAYLTIDDSPTSKMIEQIDFLAEQDIQAIWFSVGNLMEQRPESIIYAIQMGHIIGNHSYSHPHFSEITIEEAREEIRQTELIIEELYKQAGVERPAKLFRFPYGDKGGQKGHSLYASYVGEARQRKEAIQDHLKELGFSMSSFPGITYSYFQGEDTDHDVDWLWTYDCMEWTVYSEQPMYGINSLEKVLERMEESVPEAGRGLNDSLSEEIILLHDHEHTAHLFQPIVLRLLEKGVQFRRIPL